MVRPRSNSGQLSVTWRRAGQRLRGRGARRSGIASLLAMLYLVIFSALALGFYASVTTASQLAHNDEKAMNAQIAAECGMQFIQYQLSQVRVPGNTPPNQVMQEILNDLIAQQSTSGNLAGRGITLSGNTIYFPSGTTEFVALDHQGAGFRVELVDNGDDLVKVRVQGRYRGTAITRTIQMHFEPVVSSISIFDFGVVNRGPITVNGGGLIGGGANAADGSILSMSQISNPVTLTGTSGVAGDVYMTNPKGTVAIQGGGVSIAGSTVPAVRAQHIHAGVTPPDMPIVDSAVFLPYVTDLYVDGRSEYRNVMIPANTNPTFSSDVAIKGVLYIKYPNKVTFNGKTTITGTVVVENGATPSTKNKISFGAGVEAKGMDTLPADADFPPALRALRGSTLLAPGFEVSISGHSGSIGGIMLAESFTLSGSSGGVIDGTFVGLGDSMLTFTGGSSVARTKPSGPIPAGLRFPKKYKPLKKTYTEG